MPEDDPVDPEPHAEPTMKTGSNTILRTRESTFDHASVMDHLRVCTCCNEAVEVESWALPGVSGVPWHLAQGEYVT